MLRSFLRTNDDAAMTVLRLVLGIVFFAHGAQKVPGWFGGHGWSATIAGMSQMGLPAIVVILVMLAEFGGAILLIFGALTRLGALGILAVMLGAIFMVHLRFGFFMNWYGQQPGEGYEYHLLAAAMAIALLIRGGGAFSVDHALTQPRTGMRRT